MFNIEPYLDELHEKQMILRWLINGSGIHCIPISAVSIINKEWICERYNIELTYFTRKTKNKQ